MPIAPAQLTRRILDEAARLGFFRSGIAPAGRLPQSREFERWLEEHNHGAMAYMERQAAARKDPSALVAGCRSIIVAAMNYYTPERLTEEPLRGRISRYAWGDDYHGIVLERVKALDCFISGQAPAHHGACYVDTGPVMEKVWGAQTALGWTGKHSNLISRERGSWFFIGVILTNLELVHDEPYRDYCGKCVRCIGACPTGAIVRPYVVDARLCISYLTIELRGAIPRHLRPLIGNRIFGCDDCQDVCPWNRFAVSSPESGFHPRPGNWMPGLIPLLGITSAEFQSRFRNSPVKRAKRDGFVRNVAVALGNSGRPEAVPALTAALRDSSALVRAHAAWALGRIGTRHALRELTGALGREADATVLEEIQAALADGGRDPERPG